MHSIPESYKPLGVIFWKLIADHIFLEVVPRCLYLGIAIPCICPRIFLGFVGIIIITIPGSLLRLTSLTLLRCCFVFSRIILLRALHYLFGGIFL
ncbi:hypothetical protein M434DRAFT_310732 [Hypoxylon sp. CO27-5]|nr:hypothetical protein M434DRAFT_310732 [Hypoxylon sp. CO27-5]